MHLLCLARGLQENPTCITAKNLAERTREEALADNPKTAFLLAVASENEGLALIAWRRPPAAGAAAALVAAAVAAIGSGNFGGGAHLHQRLLLDPDTLAPVKVRFRMASAGLAEESAGSLRDRRLRR